MNILIFNCGSSSEGFKVFKIDDDAEPTVLISGKVKNIGNNTQMEPTLFWKFGIEEGQRPVSVSNHRSAAERILSLLEEKEINIDKVGHRFVHGGTHFHNSLEINDEVIRRLMDCLPLAPIHNPNSLSVISVCRNLLPGIPQYAVFDTSFHSKMPAESYSYAIPHDLVKKYHFRKYGFHGLSYQYVSEKIAELTNTPFERLKLIMCHLGTGGSSVACTKNGETFDTSMGYSPLPGLVMSTRSGDIDPEIVFRLAENGMAIDDINNILNNQSGLLGLSGGYSSNLAEIIEASEKGNKNCELAYDVYVHRLKFYIGAFLFLMDGADAIVFTDDVGVESWKLRERVCSDAGQFGFAIDPQKNQAASVNGPMMISPEGTCPQIWVIPNDEEYVILNEMKRLF